MTWINTIAYEESESDLRKLYDRVKGPDNNVDLQVVVEGAGPDVTAAGGDDARRRPRPP